MELKDRLKQVMDRRGITPYNIGKNTPISKQSVMQYLDGGKPSSEYLAILAQYLEVNIDWLLTGNGPMFKSTESDPANDIVATYEVPLLPISAFGGTLSGFYDEVMERDCEKIISPIKNADFAITVSGDSMAPEYPSGSKVLIKKIDESIFIDWGKTYVLDTINGTVIKNIYPSEKEGHIICRSINKNYPDFEIALSVDIVFGVYRVLMCFSLK